MFENSFLTFSQILRTRSIGLAANLRGTSTVCQCNWVKLLHFNINNSIDIVSNMRKACASKFSMCIDTFLGGLFVTLGVQLTLSDY